GKLSLMPVLGNLDDLVLIASEYHAVHPFTNELFVDKPLFEVHALCMHDFPRFYPVVNAFLDLVRARPDASESRHQVTATPR
ncbi:hypothetical protein ABTK20_21880, partial [Acinetobacter baumannii]